MKKCLAAFVICASILSRAAVQCDSPKISSFVLERLDGTKVTIGSTPWKEKRLTILHIWEFWCAPCQMEFPHLLEFANAHRDISFVAASESSNKKNINAFLAVLNYTDKANVLVCINARKDFSFGNTVVPTTVFIDRTGTVVKWIEGSVDWQSPGAEKMIKAFRAGKPVPNP